MGSYNRLEYIILILHFTKKGVFPNGQFTLRSFLTCEKFPLNFCSRVHTEESLRNAVHTEEFFRNEKISQVVWKFPQSE